MSADTAPATPSPLTAPQAGLVEDLRALLGEDRVFCDDDARRFYTQDVFTNGPAALAVIRPADTQQLSGALKRITAAGMAAVPRGGGMSYTSGYIPPTGDSVVVDMSGMDRIVDIDETNMTVTVEAGCTWKALHETLSPKGLRPPFWGTLSGIKATVGGGLSQNSVFWGCGQAGTAAESVLALEVVLADGTVVKTGSWAHASGNTETQPFFRQYGPDLTGLFTSDAGALAFKTRIVLRLVRVARAKAYASFSFEDWPALFRAMHDIGRDGLASECFAFDPFLQGQRMKRESLAKDVKALAGVVKGQGTLLKGLKEGLKVAVAGRRYMDDVPYSLHVICEGRSEAAAYADCTAVKAICAREGGSEIENSIPKILAANPFGPVNNMVGPEGERWVPIHGLFSHGRADEAMERLKALETTHADLIERHDIGIGYLCLTVSTTIFLIEPVFFWPDALNDLHRASLEPDALARINEFDANPDARTAVEQLRTAMLDIFQDCGAAHLQIGRTYRYGKTMSPTTRTLLEAIKTAVDPDGRVNPGALGLH